MTTLGDAPIQPEYIEQMNAIARGLDDILNDGKRGADRRIYPAVRAE